VKPLARRFRRPRYMGVGLCALVSASLLPAAYAVAAPSHTMPRSVVAVANETALAHAAAVRNEFGLRNDARFVSQTLQIRGLATSPLGVPLTAPEVAEMARRDAVGRALHNLDSALLAEAPATYAGSWLDQKAGGVVVVAFTSPNVSALSAAVKTLPRGTSVQAVTSRFTLNELTDAYNRLEKNLPQLTEQLGVASIALQPQHDQVQLQLQPSAPATAAATIAASYGGAVAVERLGTVLGVTADRNASTGKLYGGSRITWESSPSAASGLTCTSDTTATSGNLSYVVTAGHCGHAGYWFMGSFGSPEGTGQRNGFYGANTTSCDCTLFGPVTNNVAASSSQVIVNGGALYSFTSYAQASGDYYIGEPACISGVTTNADICDQIRSNSASYVGNELGKTTTMQNLIEFYCPDRGGDSGAPIGNGPRWLGINSGGYNQEGTSNSCGSSSQGEVLASQVAYLYSVTGGVPNLPAR